MMTVDIVPFIIDSCEKYTHNHSFHSLTLNYFPIFVWNIFQLLEAAD